MADLALLVILALLLAFLADEIPLVGPVLVAAPTAGAVLALGRHDWPTLVARAALAALLYAGPYRASRRKFTGLQAHRFRGDRWSFAVDRVWARVRGRRTFVGVADGEIGLRVECPPSADLALILGMLDRSAAAHDGTWYEERAYRRYRPERTHT